MTIPTVDQLPDGPTPDDPTNFATEADALVAAVRVGITQLNATIAALNAVIGPGIPGGTAAAGTLTGNTLAANVLASSLTSTGVLANPAASGVATGYAPPYIKLREEQTSGTQGGTFTAGSWQKRTLNTEVNDAGGYASLSSSVIALLAGTYSFRVRAPARAVDQHKVRLANTSDSIYYYGSNAYTNSAGDYESTDSVVSGRFVITGTKNFEVQHYCTTTKATNGLGQAAGFSVVEVYAEIEFWKES